MVVVRPLDLASFNFVGRGGRAVGAERGEHAVIGEMAAACARVTLGKVRPGSRFRACGVCRSRLPAQHQLLLPARKRASRILHAVDTATHLV